MQLPFSTGSPYDNLPASKRIPVRSNIHPDVYNYLFRELLTYHGSQGEVVAAILNKLYTHLQSRNDIGNYTKSDGTIHGVPDVSITPIITRVIESVNFGLPDCGPDRQTDSLNDSGGVATTRDGTSPVADSATDSPGKTISTEGLRALGKAILAGSD